MKRAALVSWLVPLVLCLAGGAAAQTGKARGKVIDGDGLPVPAAVIRLATGGNAPIFFEAKTSDKGEFVVITTQTSGPWAVTAKKEGYTDYAFEQFISVPLGGVTEIPTIKLWVIGDKRAPLRVSAEEAAKIEAARKALAALQEEFSKAVSLVSAGQAAQAAGDAAGAQQKYDEAVVAYKALIAKNADIPEAHFNLGVAYKYKQQWEDAAAAYLKAAELKPDLLDAWVGAGTAYLNAGQPDKAIEVLSKAAATFPDNAKLNFLLAVTSYNAGKYPEAAALFNKVKDAEPNGAEPYYYLGMIAVASNKVAESIPLLEKYLSMNPTNAQNAQAARDVVAALKPKK